MPARRFAITRHYKTTLENQGTNDEHYWRFTDARRRKMADYHPLITRAVAGLSNNSAEARRTLYERARAALVSQLRSIDPPLSETEITGERQMLEDVIHKVEAESVRKARTGPRPAGKGERDFKKPRFAEALRKEAPPPHKLNKPFPGDASRFDPQASARSRLLGARGLQRPREEFKGFRRAATEAQVRDPSDLHEQEWRNGSAERFDDKQPSDLHEDVWRPLEPADHYREPRPPRSYGLAKLAFLLLIIIGLGAVISWQWSDINGLYQFVSNLRSRQSQTAQQPAGEPKFGGGVPQEQMRAQPPAAAPNAKSSPAVAQRVVLYEEDPGNPQGKQYVGSAVWRAETVSPGSGLAPELQIRANVTIPDRKMTVTWSLRRNADQALPASHTIEIMFNLPPDFPGDSIAKVPGVLMKESEQARGVPLAGLAVKVTNGFFLIGLSAVDADVQRNLQLLKERPWFDVPIVYNNGGRAILALEKGPSGDRAFADAFAAWGK
jgi:hypothetical protein